MTMSTIVILLVMYILGISKAEIYVTDKHFGIAYAKYKSSVSEFGPDTFTSESILILAQPLNACTLLKPPPRGVEHRFSVLVSSTDCPFDDKVFNAQLSNYSAVIVFSEPNQRRHAMDGHTHVDKIRIPSVMIDYDDQVDIYQYTWDNAKYTYVVNILSYYNIPMKYILLALLVLAGSSLLILLGCFLIHMCTLWIRSRRGRLSKRHLRKLPTRPFNKQSDPYDTCPICLEEFIEREKLRILPCRHAFHLGCIDPWLLGNRRRCPVCNQTVVLAGAPPPPPSVHEGGHDDDEDTAQFNQPPRPSIARFFQRVAFPIRRAFERVRPGHRNQDDVGSGDRERLLTGGDDSTQQDVSTAYAQVEPVNEHHHQSTSPDAVVHDSDEPQVFNETALLPTGLDDIPPLELDRQSAHSLDIASVDGDKELLLSRSNP